MYFTSEEMFGVTSRFLNVFEEQEFAVPAALGFVCAAGSCTDVPSLHGVPLGTLSRRDSLASTLERMCFSYLLNSCCQSRPGSLGGFCSTSLEVK